MEKGENLILRKVSNAICLYEFNPQTKAELIRSGIIGLHNFPQSTYGALEVGIAIVGDVPRFRNFVLNELPTFYPTFDKKALEKTIAELDLRYRRNKSECGEK